MSVRPRMEFQGERHRIWTEPGLARYVIAQVGGGDPWVTRGGETRADRAGRRHRRSSVVFPVVIFLSIASALRTSSTELLGPPHPQPLVFASASLGDVCTKNNASQRRRRRQNGERRTERQRPNAVIFLSRHKIERDVRGTGRREGRKEGGRERGTTGDGRRRARATGGELKATPNSHRNISLSVSLGGWSGAVAATPPTPFSQQGGPLGRVHSAALTLKNTAAAAASLLVSKKLNQIHSSRRRRSDPDRNVTFTLHRPPPLHRKKS